MKLIQSLAFGFVLFLSVNTYGQDTTATRKTKTGIAAIPMINYNRTQGVVAGAMISGFYKVNSLDTVSPSSSSGIIGIYTEQKSYVLLAHSQLYLDQDRWRILAALGKVNVNFQFYLENPISSTGNFYDYTTDANLLLLQVQRKVYKRIYVGPTGSLINSTTTYGFPGTTGEDSMTISKLNSVGYIICNDSRDHVMYPSKGLFLNFKNQFYRSWIGSDFEFVRYILTYNQFIGLDKNSKKIIALRANLNITTGEVPFEGQTVVGGDDIRGYSEGKYRNDQVYTLQAEYRWNFYKRFGAVVFGGIASAVEEFKDIANNELLPGFGVGLRFRMLPSEKINIGIDGAVGKNDYSITFRIGEAFGR